MEKVKLIYSLIIIILYIPLVFLGTNVFFSKYTGQDAYYPYEDCYGIRPVDKAQTINETEEQQRCIKEQNKKQREFEKDKNSYNSRKYIGITIFNLIILIITLFLVLDSSILLGLFAGSTISTFISTIMYFATNSKIGFGVLVLLFITVIYIINKHRDRLWSNSQSKKKK